MYYNCFNDHTSAYTLGDEQYVYILVNISSPVSQQQPDVVDLALSGELVQTASTDSCQPELFYTSMIV